MSATVKVWEAKETGDWGEDNLLGRRMARQCIQTMREQEAPLLLGAVVREVVAKGRYGGIEIGFFQEIAEETL